MNSMRYEKPSILAEIPRAGHVVIEASAGTGKTYTLEHLVVDLLLNNEDCSIDNILVVTFTRRATAELRRRVRTILTKILAQFEAQDPSKSCHPDTPHWEIDADGAARLRQAVLGFDRAEIFTIHSFCQKLLTENAFQNHQLFDLELVDEKALFDDCYQDILRTKISTDPTLKAWFDAWMHPKVSGKTDALGKALKEIYSSTGRLTRSEYQPEAFSTPDALLEDVEATTTKSHLAWKQPGWKTDILGHLLEPIADEMKRRKQSEGLYTYDDMLKLVDESLARTTGGAASEQSFLASLRAQYRYALIDEFQDTDPVQWNIFHRLFVQDTHSHRLFLIGDPKQAIYKFRGADVWTYLRAIDAISPQPGELNSRSNRVILGTNYRSTHAMVSAYNAIFEQLSSSPEDSFFTNQKINYHNAVRPDPNAQHLTRYLDDAPIKRAAISAMRVNEGKKKEHVAPRWIDWMLAEIESILWGRGRFEIPDETQKDAFRPLNASDIFVLTNSNAESHEMGRRMRERRIPYSFYRQGGLFESGEALDILALLRGIAHPNLRDKRRAAFRSPFFAIPIRELAEFDESNAGEAAFSLLRQWRAMAQKHEFTRLFRKIVDQSGILLREVLLGQGERALTNYQHIFEVLGEEASQGDKDLGDLIGWLARKIEGSAGEDDQDLQRLETDRPAVQVMTMHKSKGLEAEVVFIYGGFANGTRGATTFINSDDPSRPDAQRITLVSGSGSYLGDKKKTVDGKSITVSHPQSLRVKNQSQWDSQRVMYVAITRAKSRLYLCYAGCDAGYGRDGRHEALVRSLDRLYQCNPVPGALEFIDIGEVDSHEDSLKTEHIDEKMWTSALQHLNSPIEIDTPDWGKISHKGRQMTAFSNIKKHTPSRENIVADDEAHEKDAPPQPPADPRFDAQTPMPRGGTEYGSFLHNILEDLSDYSTTLACKNATEWLAREEVKRVFDHRGKVDRIGEEFQPYSARILFDTLRTPLDLDGSNERVSIAQIPMAKIAKEIDFHFPMPQENIDFGPWPEDAPTIERGWIKGSIDLTFEHQTKIYIADWKSNYFKDFCAGAVAKALDESYALQARIYTLAIVRMLGIANERDYEARFGGCAYLMLRAMRPEAPVGHGVAICRPSWDELRIWDENLRQHPAEWNAPLAVFS